MLLCAAVSNCSFPDYAFQAGTTNGGAGSSGGAGTPSAGGAGAGGRAGSGGSGGSGLVAGLDGGVDAGAAGVGGSGNAGGSAGEAGSGGTPCVYPTPVSYPPHCFDHNLGDGETGVDCGGPECSPCWSTQSCAREADCLSSVCTNNVCVPELSSFLYLPFEASAQATTPKFRLNFRYDGARTYLDYLKIRYYFNRNGETEPLLDPSPQATMDPKDSVTDITPLVVTSVHRFPPGPGSASQLPTNSYLEIGFTEHLSIPTGTKFEITQQLSAGASSKKFDQLSHYSFRATSGTNEAITVHENERLLWGVAPPMQLLPACALTQAVNMNGPALTVSGESLAAEADESFTFNGGSTFANATAKPVPTTDANTTKLLTTARTLNTGDSAVWPVNDGKYWAYAWLTSTVASDSGTLHFGDTIADRFAGMANGTPSNARWALVGPYSVTVTGSTLTLTVEGTVHIAGLKLYEAAPP